MPSCENNHPLPIIREILPHIIQHKSAPDSDYWATLMSRVAMERDRVSFMKIYTYFAPRLEHFLCNKGMQPAWAEGLVQDAMIVLWRKAHTFNPEYAHLGTWLYRITRNLYIDFIRHESHGLVTPQDLDQLEEKKSSIYYSTPELCVEQRLLDKAIDNLTPIQSKCLRMNYLEGKSHGEISQELQMPLGTVKSILRTAFHRLAHTIIHETKRHLP